MYRNRRSLVTSNWASRSSPATSHDPAWAHLLVSCECKTTRSPSRATCPVPFRKANQYLPRQWASDAKALCRPSATIVRFSSGLTEGSNACWAVPLAARDNRTPTTNAQTPAIRIGLSQINEALYILVAPRSGSGRLNSRYHTGPAILPGHLTAATAPTGRGHYVPVAKYDSRLLSWSTLL